jgi:hypothetical protein
MSTGKEAVAKKKLPVNYFSSENGSFPQSRRQSACLLVTRAFYGSRHFATLHNNAA